VKRRVHIVAALLLCMTFGLHWVVLQSVAWTTMVIERTCSTSLRSALATTFDGQHPCKLCVVVKAGKAAESTAKVPFKQPKLEMFTLASVAWTSEFREHAEIAVPYVATPVSRSDRPPLPPPRSA
jgi:hypothetical protein